MDTEHGQLVELWGETLRNSMKHGANTGGTGEGSLICILRYNPVLMS